MSEINYVKNSNTLAHQPQFYRVCGKQTQKKNIWQPPSASIASAAAPDPVAVAEARSTHNTHDICFSTGCTWRKRKKRRVTKGERRSSSTDSDSQLNHMSSCVFVAFIWFAFSTLFCVFSGSLEKGTRSRSRRRRRKRNPISMLSGAVCKSVQDVCHCQLCPASVSTWRESSSTAIIIYIPFSEYDIMAHKARRTCFKTTLPGIIYSPQSNQSENHSDLFRNS